MIAAFPHPQSPSLAFVERKRDDAACRTCGDIATIGADGAKAEEDGSAAVAVNRLATR